MEYEFKFVDITVDFDRQSRGRAERFFKKLEEKDYYLCDHRDQIYDDGFRIETLRKPWLEIEDVVRIAEELSIPLRKVKFDYYHPYGVEDPYGEDAPRQSVSWPEE